LAAEPRFSIHPALGFSMYRLSYLLSLLHHRPAEIDK